MWVPVHLSYDMKGIRSNNTSNMWAYGVAFDRKLRVSLFRNKNLHLCLVCFIPIGSSSCSPFFPCSIQDYANATHTSKACDLDITPCIRVLLEFVHAYTHNLFSRSREDSIWEMTGTIWNQKKKAFPSNKHTTRSLFMQTITPEGGTR